MWLLQDVCRCDNKVLWRWQWQHQNKKQKLGWGRETSACTINVMKYQVDAYPQITKELTEQNLQVLSLYLSWLCSAGYTITLRSTDTVLSRNSSPLLCDKNLAFEKKKNSRTWQNGNKCCGAMEWSFHSTVIIANLCTSDKGVTLLTPNLHLRLKSIWIHW